MDPTKTNSYRRWRNRVIPKGFSRTFLSTDDSFKQENSVAPGRSLGANGSVFKSPGEVAEIQGLLKTLEAEYRTAVAYRKDKVQEIKKRIKQGLYRVPGKLVVDKWFPE
jgi:hypothetical protein